MQKAAKHGHQEAINTLATMMISGQGQDPDVAEALKLYERAADAKSVSACFNLASIYLGLRPTAGVASDEEKGMHYLKKAAELGSVLAKMHLAQKYANRVLDADLEPVKRTKYYSDMARLTLAVAESEDREYAAVGMFHYGKLIVTGKTLSGKMSEGLDYLMRAAKLNWEPALEFLANIVEAGQYGVTAAPEKAQKLRARAAEIKQLKRRPRSQSVI
jgi:TPR repeat protein